MSGLWEVADRCGVCGATAWTPEAEICGKRYGRCGSCGVVRLVDRIREDRLDVIYGNYYQTVPLGPSLAEQLANPTFAFRRSRLESALAERPRQIFEIGCGDGNFLASLRGAGWTVSGSEYGETAARASARHALDIRAIDIVASPPSETFPVVAAYHVLEHMYDPAAWLKAANGMLDPTGLLHLQVPNYAAFTRTVSGESWASWRFPEHVYFYTPGTLSSTLGRAGFEVISMTTWDPWHGPGSTTASLVNAARRRLIGRPTWTVDVERVWSAGGPEIVPVAAHSGVRRIGRAALTLAAEALSRAEAAVGRGAVVDVLAVRS